MYRSHQIFSGKSGFESKSEQYFQHTYAQDQIWVTLSGTQSHPICQYCALLQVSVKVSSRLFDRVRIKWGEYEEKCLLGLLKSCISCSLVTTAIWSYYKSLYPWRRERMPYLISLILRLPNSVLCMKINIQLKNNEMWLTYLLWILKGKSSSIH